MKKLLKDSSKQSVQDVKWQILEFVYLGFSLSRTLERCPSVCLEESYCKCVLKVSTLPCPDCFVFKSELVVEDRVKRLKEYSGKASF